MTFDDLKNTFFNFEERLLFWITIFKDSFLLFNKEHAFLMERLVCP